MPFSRKTEDAIMAVLVKRVNKMYVGVYTWQPQPFVFRGTAAGASLTYVSEVFLHHHHLVYHFCFLRLCDGPRERDELSEAEVLTYVTHSTTVVVLVVGY